MKNTRLYLMLYFLLTLTFTYGQEIVVSDDISIQGSSFYDILGEVDNRYLLIRNKLSRKYLDIYDKNLKSSRSMELLTNYNDAKVVGIGTTTSHFNLFFNHSIRRQKAINIHQYDNSGVLLDSLVINHNIRFVKNVRFVNSNSKKVSLIFSFSDNGWCDFFVFDNDNFNLLWNKRIKLLRDIKRNFNLIKINDQGDIVLLSKVPRELFGKDKGLYNLTLINSSSHFTSLLDFKKDYTVYSLDLSFNIANHNIININGFYCDNNDKVLGTLILNSTIGDLSKEKYFKIIPFEKQILSKFYKSDFNEQDYISDLYIKNYISKSDGGYIIVGEVRKEFLRRRAGSDRFHNSRDNNWTDYNNKDIIILNFSNRDSLAQVSILYKNQFSQDDNLMFSSYFLAQNNKELSFFFNDQINLNTTITNFTIDNRGVQKRNTLFNTEGNYVYLRFMDAIQIGYKTILVPSQEGNTLNIVKITY